MARTTEEIIVIMDEEQAAQPDLADLNSTSSSAIYTLWKYIVGQCINVLEQLWDRKQVEIETSFQYGVPPSLYWLRSKAFEFQYGDTLIMDTNSDSAYFLIPRYDPVDTDNQIITRCTVSQAAGVVSLYVAKSDPPAKLSVGELAAIQDYYINSGDGTNQAIGIGYGGQVLTCVSLDPDLLYIEGTITYNGKFSETIQDDCQTAVEDFISSLGITPVFRTVDLINVLKGVPGFVDINIVNLSARSAATVWLSGTSLITASAISATSYTTAAGYMITETTATFTFADKVTFTAV